jgi:uncharacterized protein (TIGR04255 family)
MDGDYLNPPVTEAICEFRIALDTEWDLTVPGLYYARVRDELPVREQRRVRNVEVIMAEEGLREELLVRERMHYFTPDLANGIQVGPHLLAVNMLKPYTSWSRFRPRIEHAFQVLRDIVEVKTLEGIGLHYINVIEVSEGNADARKYISLVPPLAEILPGRPESLLVGCEIPFEEGREACRVEITDAIPQEKEGSAFLLDIEYYLSSPNTLSADEAMTWLDGAHDRLVEIFEACILEPAREIFRGT